MKAVTLDADDSGVAVITLNAAESKNAWSPELERAFYDVLRTADRDPAIRAAVLTGAGSTFCPGVGTGRLDQVAGSGVDFTGRLPFSTTLTFRKPLIAAINGACAGAGLAQALMCDVRFAAATAKFSTSFARRGLPAEHGMSWLLPRLIGLERATDLLLSARVFDAREARELGILSRVTEPNSLLNEAQAYARDIAANCAPESVALIKGQILADLDATYAAALDRAYRATVHASRQPTFREGIDAFIGKRPPNFPALDPDFDPAALLGAPLPAIVVDPGAANRSHSE
ncbi:MAG TPA: enoyl-CoA hydratase-related protein [Mycobacteriales bacterium]|nr:enoyl-CoA hydratase-related protein [Mycobacteriales bacterium]